MQTYLRLHRGKLVLAILMAVFKAGTTVFTAFYMKAIMDAVYLRAYQRIPGFIVVGVIFLLALASSNYLYQTATARFVQACSKSLRQDTFSGILQMDLNTFQADSSAKYISILNNDLTVIEEKYLKGIPELVVNFSLYIGSVLALFYFSPVLAVVGLAGSLLPMTVPNLLNKTLQKKQGEASAQLDAYNTAMKDAFNGFEVIKSFNAAKQVLHKFRKINSNVAAGKYAVTKAESLADGISILAVQVSFYANFIVGAAMVIQGHLTLGTMMGAVQTMNYVVGPVLEVVERLAQWSSAKASVKRTTKLLQAPASAGQTQRQKVQSLFPLAVAGLGFAYKAGHSVLDKVDFTFEKGKKYAIVGKSGCGKSTFIKLLMLYYANYQGHIQFGGVEAKQIDKEDFYRKVSMIHQNIIAFDDSLRNNITMCQDYPEAEIRQATEDAGLQDYIAQLPNGLDSAIEENGRNLSGGERQRIAIARAFLHKMELLVIDEATSSLDTTTAMQIENTILSRKALTAIVITHKLSETILKQYDDILVLHEGRIVEHGGFADLMARKGYFYSFYTVG